MPSRPRSCLATLVVAMFAVAVVLAAAAVRAGAPSPILVVPPSRVGVDLASDLPADVKLAAASAWRLVGIDEPDLAVTTQRVTAIAGDGSAGRPQGRLVASIPAGKKPDRPRRFRLEPAGAGSGGEIAAFRFKEIDEKSLGLFDGDRPVLTYNHGVITKEEIPEKDHRRSRGCYIHPVWGLNGEVLTDDFPRDHYHHHGIFWTWPHIVVGGQEYDLWAGPGIKQTFVRWFCREAGPVAAVLGVENGWFVGEKQVMIERVWIRVYKAADGSRSLDLEFAWIPVDEPITLWGAPNKSYGGLTVRFAPPSRKDENTVITVPSGPAEADLPETRLPWADFTSKLGGASMQSGAAVFVDPGHPDYPPTWLTRHYGPLCVGWPGVESKTFQPGSPIRLNYRIWIHKAAVETDQIQQAYDAYAAAMNAGWE